MAAKSTTAGDQAFPDPVIHEFAPVSRQLAACDSRYDLLTGATAKAIGEAISAEIRASPCRVLSLDVFDTFLLRNDKAETMRFYELSHMIRDRVAQKQGASGNAVPSALDFLLARLYALDVSYRTRKIIAGCREGHIREVVKTASRSLGLPETVEALMLETEMDYEANNLRPNPVLIEVITAFRANGGKVILMSDMYLGRTEIGAIIKRLNARAPELIDAIFSSADCIVSKRSGKMFGFVQNELDVPPEAFFHIGDALDGDVYKAREAGWRALHFPVSRKESARRDQSLCEFNNEMRRLGHDLTRWSKV